MAVELRENPSNRNSLYNGAGGVTLSAGVYTEIARITIVKNGPKRVVLTGNVTVADLTGLKLTRSASPGVAGVTVAQDSQFSDINSAGGTPLVLSVLPASPQTTAAASAFQLELCGPGEWVLFAKSAGAAVVAVDAVLA